jgi:small-conductance mechanosensitive channel
MNDPITAGLSFNWAKFTGFWDGVTHSLVPYLLSPIRLGEVAAILAALLLSLVLAPKLARFTLAQAKRDKLPKPARDALVSTAIVMLPLTWLLLQWFTLITARQIVAADPALVATAKELARKDFVLSYEGGLILIAVNLLSAWVILRFASRLIRQTIWSNLIFAVVWATVALNILGLLGPLLASLDQSALSFGKVRISAYTVLKGMVALAVLLWAASLASRFLAERIRHIEELTPSLQVLISKLLQFVLIAIAVLLALNVVGIDLTALTVFSGAIGIGLGLGLQKGASNVASGLMLLLDKSIKPGDIVSVGNTFGWVTSLGGRYVSIRTRDGIEHLIPNETFISQGVENWSFNDREVRLKIAIGVAYDTDLRLAQRLALEAAAETGRILRKPEPSCLLMRFGDSAIELELRVWISDPERGVSNVKSEVLFKIWEKFKAAKVEIPFPQQVLHVVPPSPSALGLGDPAARVAE